MAANNKLYFDSLGDNFENFMDDYDVSRRCYLIFDDLLADVPLKGKKVLEVGCGTGRISSQIVKKKADLTVLDIGENLVRQVCEKYSCRGITADACHIPFPDNMFDVVISSECIEHTLEPIQAIREMCRVCREGGSVCITSPNKIWYPILWLAVKTGYRKFRGIENWLFARRAYTVMKEAGMGELRRSGCHLWPFQLNFTRALLRRIDMSAGRYLYPMMINYGIKGVKKVNVC